ncbi:Uncharacterised protein [Paenibacillus macerans]|uniref:Uncharacterized protein n=1 Tax=Paenibacillus macerans TaxID=44252 RepID=A0A090ZI36_PAEMA|nr:hypothetical protein DJ90_384 [Paenibacillus macerans]GBK62859.1 hypothetical protein PbDSM24746_28630 [Paenibacillus macerans]GBK69171.1 hypothetical protein PbJCM17693_28790 [Paenibacillus macerans]GIP11241.1 hypothetical protein J1TS5_34110 [Paenibacillus macerans]SUD26865.1 Uncharacterised protein [Paenibacillus macerans]
MVDKMNNVLRFNLNVLHAPFTLFDSNLKETMQMGQISLFWKVYL